MIVSYIGWVGRTHTYIYAYTYTYLYIYTYTYIHTNTHIYIYIYIHLVVVVVHTVTTDDVVAFGPQMEGAPLLPEIAFQRSHLLFVRFGR